MARRAPSRSGGATWPRRTSDGRGALLARVALGAVLLPHGAQKGFGWFGGEGLRGTIDSMVGDGLPAVVPVLVVAVELLGSLGLVLGLLGRVAAAGVALVMLGAALLVHLPHGFFMNWTGRQAGEGLEYHVLALALAGVVLIEGSGALSLDRALSRRVPEPAPGERAHVGVTAPDADPAVPADPQTASRR